MFKISFKNSYEQLPDVFYKYSRPQPTKSPQLLLWNKNLATDLQFFNEGIDAKEIASFFSGGTWPSSVRSLSQAYSGHQFGHFSPSLGDGRAILLGEIEDRWGQKRDIHLKGSGKTPFSRRGDGRSALGPVLREYLVSEAMQGLGIPTTRSLAVIETGDVVYRQEGEVPGGLLVRVAQSHIRVGTFEFAAMQKESSLLKTFADYVIDRHYASAKQAQNPYVEFLNLVVQAQARLVAQWMGVGFIHGVMNTDNMTISGETIDFGPCAFMNTYNPKTVYSYIDQNGRYAYGNQPQVAQWNLRVLAEALWPLLGHEEKEIDPVVDLAMQLYAHTFNEEWTTLMSLKLGAHSSSETHLVFIQEFLMILMDHKLDYTLSFRYVMQKMGDSPFDVLDLDTCFKQLDSWILKWQDHLKTQDKGGEEGQQQKIERMAQVNPIYIPRNHILEIALKKSTEQKDMSLFQQMLEVVSSPFVWQKGEEFFLKSPQPGQDITNTFCGT